MAGSGLYLVGYDQQYKQVGAAIAQLRADQGVNTFTATQEIRIVRSGSYEPFSVEANQLIPSGSARLRFTVLSGVEATVSGRVAPDRGHFGASIDAPYTDIFGLRFQDFGKGVVYGSNADYGRVVNTRIENCSNAGIWMDGATDALVLNNALIDNDIGLGFTNAGNIAAMFNTIYQRQGKEAGVFLDIASNGRVYLWSNILNCLGHTCLRFYRRDAALLTADWNNYWAPGGSVAEIWERYGDSSLLKETRVTYSAWQDYAGHDEQSMSADPVFVNALPATAAPDIDVRLASSSPANRGSIAWGEQHSYSTALLPGWVDATLLTTDKDGNARGAVTSATKQIADRTLAIDYIYPVTTIGAFDILAQPSFYDAPIFSDEQVATPSGHSTRRSVVERSAGAYAKEVKCWTPRVHRGYFWVRDREYYLYAQKRGCTLQDISRTFWVTSVNLIGSTVAVSIGDDVVPEASWDIHGDQFVLFHKDLNITSENDQVKVTGQYDEWSQVSQGFHRKTITLYLTIRDGETRYVLPEAVKDSGPVVVTDDTIRRMNDRDFLPQQFRIKTSTVPGEESEVEFRGGNLLLNPDFHYGSADPADWEVQGVSSTQVLNASGRWPIRGEHMVALSGGPNTGQYVGQQVRIDPDDAYFFSCYFGGGELMFQAVYFDAMNREITGYAHTVNLAPITGWHRVGARLTNATSAEVNTGAPDITSWFTASDIAIPSDATHVLLKLSAADTGYVDCVQFEKGFRPTKYTSLPRGADLTVEYEEGEGRFYEVEDLAISAVRNPMHAGFLYVGAVPAKQFDSGAPQDSTTLSDWLWTTGRTQVLPWAKMHGINKMVRAVDFSDLDAVKAPREISPGLAVPNPAEININPGVVLSRQDDSGEYFGLEVRDDQGNPYAFERVQMDIYCDNGAFPGYLSLSDWGLPTELGQSIEGITNERGQLSVRYIPPSSDRIEYRGTEPVATEQFGTGDSQLYQYAFVDLPYPVNPTNHGNPTIHQEDGTLVSVTGVTTSSRIYPVSEGQNAAYHLTGYYPVPKTTVFQLEARTGGLSYPYEETRNNILGQSQFRVNYEQGKMTIKGLTRQPARVVMQTRTIWRDPKFPYRLYFDSRYLDQVTGDLVVRYDSFAKLQARALQPDGLADGSDAWREFNTMIMQNPHRGEVT
jgi:hypothetical protein